MRSPNQYIREAFKAYIKTLGYAVYDRGRKVNDYPHVIIGEQTAIENSAQDRFGNIATINIEVVNGWASDYGDRSTADAIVNAITAIAQKPGIALTVAYFNVTALTVDNIMTYTEQTQTQTIHTTVIRFKLQIFEY